MNSETQEGNTAWSHLGRPHRRLCKRRSWFSRWSVPFSGRFYEAESEPGELASSCSGHQASVASAWDVSLVGESLGWSRSAWTPSQNSRWTHISVIREQLSGWGAGWWKEGRGFPARDSIKYWLWLKCRKCRQVGLLLPPFDSLCGQGIAMVQQIFSWQSVWGASVAEQRLKLCPCCERTEHLCTVWTVRQGLFLQRY